MAKKTKKVEVQEPQTQETVTIEKPKTIVKPKSKRFQSTSLEDNWEIKDRKYYLKNNKTPLSYSIRATDIYWFDEVKGYEREIKCTSNQRSVFVDEFPEKSQARLEHIVFRNGILHVPKEKQVMQKILSLYHPHKDKLYAEHKPQVEAASQLDWLELELQALNVATNLDVDMMEAVLRVEKGSSVSNLTSKELKRDTLIFAKKNPMAFLELVQDSNVHLRNIGIKAVEMGIIRISDDNRTFFWSNTDRKLFNVPFDEHPYSALAAWFKTDEGMEVFASIEKRLN